MVSTRERMEYISNWIWDLQQRKIGVTKEVMEKLIGGVTGSLAQYMKNKTYAQPLMIQVNTLFWSLIYVYVEILTADHETDWEEYKHCTVFITH